MTRRALQSRFRSLERRGPGLRLCLLSVLCLVTFLCGCTAQASSSSSSPTSGGPDGHSSSVAPAREGHPAASQRVTFIPEHLTLRGHGSAEVQPAETVDGLLKVPENVQHVGWWDGSAQAGEPFGSTVIAGHVDSATEGIGFFARLRSIKVGEMVTLRGGLTFAQISSDVGTTGTKTGAGDRQSGIQAERPASPGTDHLYRALSPRPRRIRQQSCGGRQAAWHGSLALPPGRLAYGGLTPFHGYTVASFDRYTVTQSPPSTGSGP